MKISNSNQRIKELLSELNISQTEFCQKTGLNKSALSNYLKGDRVPRQDQIDKIAKAYNINPSWLMGYDVPRNANYSDFLLDAGGKITPLLIEVPYEKRDLFTALNDRAVKLSEEDLKKALKIIKAFSDEDSEQDGGKL